MKKILRFWYELDVFGTIDTITIHTTGCRGEITFCTTTDEKHSKEQNLWSRFKSIQNRYIFRCDAVDEIFNVIKINIIWSSPILLVELPKTFYPKLSVKFDAPKRDFAPNRTKNQHVFTFFMKFSAMPPPKLQLDPTVRRDKKTVHSFGIFSQKYTCGR